MFFAAVARAREALTNAVVGLALVTGLTGAMVQPAMAASAACQQLTAYWGGGVLVTTGGVGAEFETYTGLAIGEVISYSWVRNGGDGTANDAQLYIYNDSTNPPPIPSSPGTYTVTTNENHYIEVDSGLNGNTSTMAVTASCSGAPSVTSVSPTAGPIAGGASVVITGTDLLNASAVSFGGTSASYTVNSSTQITATAPAHAAGTVDVTVTTPVGTSATNSADQYTYVSAPTVTSVSPNSGPTGGGTTVIITGTGFAFAPGTGAVKFGGTNATYTINSNTQITATSPANSAGVYDVTVTTPGGTSTYSAADQYNYVAAPTVTSVSPVRGPTGGGTTVIITGTGFASAPGTGAVKFGATDATYTINSNTQITATSPANAAGTYDVTVTTPGGTSATSAADQYTYVSAPTVTGVGPVVGPTGGGATVIIVGTGFASASATGAVSFGAASATYTINSDTQITATSPANAAGTYDVRVSTVGGASATSANDQYTYLDAPTVTSVSPTAGPTGGGTTVTINGTDFAFAPPSGAVRFGGISTIYTIINNTTITATAPAGTGTVDITVTTPGGTSATSAADQYTYVPAPTITSVSPNVGPTAGGASVTITGTYFAGASALTFGGTPATGFTVLSGTSIVATAPAASAGISDIQVTTVGGTSATGAQDQFRHVAQPIITGLSPAYAPVAGGTSVVISGQSFVNVGAVLFGGTPASSYTVDSENQITAVAPAGTGNVRVVVSAVGGTTGDTAADDLAYRRISDAPTAVSAVAGDGQVMVTFTAPLDDGNSPITLYTATASPGGATGTIAGPGAAPITVSNLTNGQSYTFTVTAENSEGPGAPSIASSSVTPQAAQSITFTNPGTQSFGTTPTLSATATSNLPVSFSSGTMAVCTVDSGGTLAFLTSGTCEIHADQVGGGAYRAAPRMSQTFTVTPVVPGAPTSVVATAGDTQVSVAFATPSNGGGATIIGYTVTVSPPDVPPFAGTGSPIVVGGLTNGVSYAFTVTAENAAGPGPASSSSNTVTPAAAQIITFVAPATQTFGTTPTLTANSDSGLPPTFTSGTPAVCTIAPTGQLAFVTAGSCTILADQAGNSSYLPAAQVIQTFTVDPILPDAPTAVSATVTGTTASVSFTAPVMTGGVAIDEYEVTALPGGATTVGATSPVSFPGLTAGQSYTFTVKARNVVGPSVASAPSGPVLPLTDQTISFSNPGQQLSTASLVLAATASSGLPVTLTATTPAVCAVASGGAVSFAGLGTCTVEASQAGDGTYAAAPVVSQSFAVVSGTVTLSPAAGSLPDGKTGLDYSQVFAASSGTAPYSFAISAGALPAGLTLTGDTLAGTPTVAGSSSFTVEATDANGVTASAAYTLQVAPSAIITLTPAAGALPNAMAGEDYTETVVASGQSGAVSYALTGTLPAGLALDASTGEISGSVDVGTQGDYSFSVTATDASGNTGSASYTLKVLVREVTVQNKAVTVPAGSTPVPVNLTAGATGGPFTGGAVVGVVPPQAGTATITGADVAAIDTTYDALYLKFTPNPQYTGVARITYALTNTQGQSAQGIVAYTLAADLAAVAEDIQPISDGFISMRSGLLAGTVDTPGLQDRRSAGSATLPGTISVTPSGNSMTMNFAASTLAATAASNAAESLVTEPVDEGGLNFWIDGTATLHFRNDSVGDHWGSLALASVGADMLLTDDLLVGVALHGDWMDEVTDTSRTSGTGLLVGPYLSAELVEGVFLDASAYYGQSWNSITSGLFSGTFDTQRLLAKASLTGQWQLSDQLTLQPAANLFYLHEEAGAYTVSDGLGNTASIAGFALDQLRASVGATLRYSVDVDGNLVITPFLGVELGLSVTNGTSGNFGRLSTGFDLTGLGAWTLGLGLEAGLENGDIQSVSVTGRARANF